MKKTIQRAAQDYKIAEIRVHQLIRQGHLSISKERHFRRSEITVESEEMDAYFQQNPDTLKEWQERLEYTQRGLRKGY
jgi:hypothetical protein